MTSSNYLVDLFSTASAPQLVEFFTDAECTVDVGLEAMRTLERVQPQKANEVLCLLYDVACYKSAEVFPGFGEEGKWFVSVVVGSADDATSIPEGDSEAEAHALAVAHLRLRERFYGAEVGEDVALAA